MEKMDIVTYGETYNRAMQGIEDMLLREDNPLRSFKKNVYPEAFQAYLRRHMETLNAIDAIYQQEEHPELWAEKLAESFGRGCEGRARRDSQKGEKERTAD